jgi:uncharacterized tellurite resistance protein B-like protein
MANLTRKDLYPAFNVSLGKTLAAAAWVDGDLNEDEMNCLKAIVLQLPFITFEDWRKLKIYLAYPISPPEQKSIINDFLEKVFHKGHSKLAIEALIQVIKADGEITTEEDRFSKELENDLQTNIGSFLKKLKFFLFKNSIQNQKSWDPDKGGREKFIHEFFDNPIYFLFRKAVLKEQLELPHSKPELQKVCLYAAVLCWFAKEDDKIDLVESEFIIKTIKEHALLSDQVAHCILKIAGILQVSELQLSQLCFSMADATTQEERNQIFVTLSKLILLDREMSTKECEYLRTAALYLEIHEKLWVQVMGNIHLKTTFST